MKTKYKVLLVFFSAVLLVSGYMTIKTKSGYIKAEKEYANLQVTTIVEGETEDKREIDLESLKSINDDCIGWIEIPNTDISYPLMAGNMDYYLKHTINGTWSNAGSIFIDSDNSPTLEDAHTIIYGHNMYTEGMFTSLQHYVDYDFWKEHQLIYIWTESGEHCYQVFSCYTAYDTDRAYTTGYEHDDVFGDLIEYMIKYSRYDTETEVTKDDTVITLSTCYNNDNIRYLVHAVQIS